MRVVAGKYKGRKLMEFSGTDIRPTSDMVRESLFNILQFEIDDANFLDLFCGTGAVGIEAISRGAKSVTFNDLDKRSIDLTNKNLSKLGIEDGVTVSRSDAVAFLQSTSKKFDIIFIDAPYASNSGQDALNNARLSISKGGLVIYENEKPFTSQVDGLVKTDERRYGRAYLTFFRGE